MDNQQVVQGPGPDLWREWRGREVSQILLAELRSRVAELQEGWLRAEYLANTLDATAMGNARAVGRAEALEDVIEWVNQQCEDEPDE